MIVECWGFRNILTPVPTLQDLKSYDSKYFQAVSPTSTSIKEGDKTTISIIPRTHEATTGNGNFLPRSHLLRFTCVTPKFGRPNSSMSTDECVCAHSHVKLLPNMRVSLQETSGHGCRVQAVGRHDERCPDGSFGGTQRTRSNRCCSDAKTPKA